MLIPCDGNSHTAFANPHMRGVGGIPGPGSGPGQLGQGALQEGWQELSLPMYLSPFGFKTFVFTHV